MLLLTKDLTVDWVSFQVAMCRFPDALARFVAVAQAMITYTASTSCKAHAWWSETQLGYKQH